MTNCAKLATLRCEPMSCSLYPCKLVRDEAWKDLQKRQKLGKLQKRGAKRGMARVGSRKRNRTQKRAVRMAKHLCLNKQS
ncbi:MAG: hypothetical protein A2W17_03535 [Planctomycetes bacterium RBG_16_41_13]|nr:MAG: hypothetical protein A2W17_03535 [Planctomycetes bacterium RBG_16_41_13]